MTPDPKPTEALKPCPFCGESRITIDAVLNTGGNVRYRRCGKCNAQGPWFTESDGVNLWNTRTPDRDRRDAELAAMRSFIESIAKGWDCDTGAGGSHASYCRCCEAEKLLASTAGTELLERLRKAEEMVFNLTQKLGAADAASVKADVDIEHYRQRLAAVTGERDEEKAIVDRVWKALGISTYEQAKPFAIDEHVTRLRDRAAAAESVSAGLRKERDELQEMLRQIPNT